MKILITGAQGQLGKDCVQVLSAAHELMETDLEVDIGDMAQVRKAVTAFGPDLILNCAAYTQVDACETNRALAWRVNVEGPANLARAAAEQEGTIYHVSTDYVFDGHRKPPAPYKEEDEPGPLSYYGKTKLEGEKAVCEGCPRHAVIRTAWLYGIEGKNILKTFLRLALEQSEQPIKVVDDQFGSPTWSYRLALQIEKLIEAKGQGIYHATSDGYCSWYELARSFLAGIGVPHNVVPCTTEEYPTPAARPRNSILENGRLKTAGLDIMPHWKADMEEFITRFRDRLLSEARGG